MSELDVMVCIFWHLTSLTMHLRKDGVGCKLCDLSTGQVFLEDWRVWGSGQTSCCNRWRANHPEERSAPRRYPRTHSFTHTLYIYITLQRPLESGELAIILQQENLQQLLFYLRAPMDIFLFQVCTLSFSYCLTVCVIILYSVQIRQIVLSTVKNYTSGYSTVTPAIASLLLLSTVAPPEFSVFWFWSRYYK